MSRYRRTKKFVDFFAGREPVRRSQRGHNPAPDLPKYDEAHVRGSIQEELGRGNRDKALVATEVCERLFSGRTLYPPGPDDDEVSQCLWALVVDAVDDVFKQNQASHVPWTTSNEVVVWEMRHMTDPGYPWERPSLDVYNAAVPSTFIEASEGDYDVLVREYLSNALVMAGMNAELANGSSSTSKRLRREARKLLNGVKWHDLYRYEGADTEANPWILDDRGRTLNWNPVHADNLNRLAQGLPPQRTTARDGTPIYPGHDAMLLWLPAVDQHALRGKIPTIKPLSWSDGSSTQEPPPTVQAFGIDMNGVSFDA